MLELNHIYKTYNPGSVNEMCLYEDFNLKVPDGQFVAVVGSNGSGKTSLLKLICGSMEPDKGEIILTQRNHSTGKEETVNLVGVSEHVRHKTIGRVYQNPALGTCPSMTILENMAIADNKGKIFGLGRCVSKKREEYYKELLKTIGLGLEDKIHIPVGYLSGGQRQCLALLLSTMTPIDFLILDEHTAALDPKTADIVMEMTDKIVHEKKVTTLMVTHNLRYAVEYGDRILMMHEGKAILDKAEEEKKTISTEEIMHIFNQISVECGN